MTTNIQIFENAEFGKVRTMQGAEGEPLFCGKDVAVALGYGNSREALRKHVEQDDVTKRDTIDALGRVQLTTFINESGLYYYLFVNHDYCCRGDNSTYKTVYARSTSRPTGG